MTRRLQRGITLIEILVAMAIGLIGITVIMQVYLVNENYRRSTVSAGGAQSNGAVALYTIERDLRMAGYGIAWGGALACQQVQWYYNGAYTNPPDPGGTLPAFALAPVVITDGGAGPDTLRIVYGNEGERVSPASVVKPMAGPGADLDMDNLQGFNQNPGDLIVLAAGTTCAMRQISETILAASKLRLQPSGTAPYNPAAGGMFPAFGGGTQVFNLGRPVVNTYSIANNSLRLWSLFTATSSTVVPAYNPVGGAIDLVEEIVGLKAQYGKDNGVDNGTVQSAAFVAGDGRVDSYDNVVPATAAQWQQVLTVRVAVLARSTHFEKPAAPGGACEATTAAPTWMGGAFSVPGGLPSCYRYRVFETIVPLRNMLWRQG